jgi:hypothetical protein
MILILLPIVIYLAIKKPRMLHRYLFLFVAALLGFYVLEIVLGILVSGYAEAFRWHNILSHFLVIFSAWICIFTMPATFVYSIQQKNLFGFRRVPTGFLSLVLIMFLTFTAYLNPHNPQEAAATVRYIVLHHYVVPLLVLGALVRWLFILKKTIDSEVIEREASFVYKS